MEVIQFDPEKLPTSQEHWCNPIGGFLSEKSFSTLLNCYPITIQRICDEHESMNIVPLPSEPVYRCGSRIRIEFRKEVWEELAAPWQDFVSQILDPNGAYLAKVKTLITEPFETRLSWHIGYDEFFITPHRDAKRKLATHLFYFNDNRNWNEAWGGHLLKLTGKRGGSDADNPHYNDFSRFERLPLVNNQSVFLYRTEESWHCVAPVKCPTFRYRLAFNVIFERINHES